MIEDIIKEHEMAAMTGRISLEQAASYAKLLDYLASLKHSS